MAIKKYSNRSEALCSKKEEYIRSTAITAGCDEEDILIVGSKITADRALEIVTDRLKANDAPVSLGVHHKLIEALRAAGRPTVHSEYYSVISSYFHISQVEYRYNYYLDGKLINMSPRKANADMDFIVAVETLDGRYRQTLGMERNQLEVWNDLLESDCVEDFEPGFRAHLLLEEDITRESRASMTILNQKLNARVRELQQEELGKGRVLDSMDILDKTYSYTTKVLAAPYYIFNYDLGGKVVTISVDAYSGQIGTPIVNNPLCYALLANPQEEPYFSVPLCVICGVAMIGIGAAIYAGIYYMKKKKFENAVAEGALKYSLVEMKKLL